MKSAANIILYSWLALYAVTAHAAGLSVSLQSEARFVYVQTLQVLNGRLRLNTDVTGLVPYTVQVAEGQKVLVIQ